jgi:hypothetical protein
MLADLDWLIRDSSINFRDSRLNLQVAAIHRMKRSTTSARTNIATVSPRMREDARGAPLSPRAKPARGARDVRARCGLASQER